MTVRRLIELLEENDHLHDLEVVSDIGISPYVEAIEGFEVVYCTAPDEDDKRVAYYEPRPNRQRMLRIGIGSLS